MSPDPSRDRSRTRDRRRARDQPRTRDQRRTSAARRKSGEISDSSSRWGVRWPIVRRELGSIRAEKTIVLAIAIQLFIAGFSSFLVVGLVSMYDPGSVEGYEVEVAVTGDDLEALLAAADDQDALEARTYDDSGDAYAAFSAGHVSAVLETSRDDDDRLIVHVTAPDEGLETTLLIVELRETLEAVERAERFANVDRLEAVPLEVPPEAEPSPYFGFTYTVLLPLLLLLPAFISGSIAVDSLIEERQRGTLELLRVAPPTFSEVVTSKLVATAGLAPLQASAWLVLLALNGIAIANAVWLVALVTALAALVVATGLFVSLTSPDRRQAQLLYSGGILGALVLSTVLPEHPANTIAKLAVDSPTRTTWLTLAGALALGVLAVVALRIAVDRFDPDDL